MPEDNVNTQFEEEAYQSFRSKVEAADWEGVNALFNELQDVGFGHLEVKFVDTLSEDELVDYTQFIQENEDYVSS